MWTSALFRILRSRLVLSAILTLSTLYCLISFWHESGENNKIDRDGETLHPRLSFLWSNDPLDNRTDAEVTSCRNSVQGREEIVDEKGYICARSDILSTGCCNVEAESSRRYACDTCHASTGCCSVYEYCISCCLHPDKKEVLEAVLGAASENVLFASVTDHFELCLAKCRTSSQSVHHENSYRDPQAKHCYTHIPVANNAPT